MANKDEFVDLAMKFSEVCGVLDRGLSGQKQGDLSQSVLEAIQQLTT